MNATAMITIVTQNKINENMNNCLNSHKTKQIANVPKTPKKIANNTRLNQKLFC